MESLHHVQQRLCNFFRYFFVNAPTRTESRVVVAEATDRVRGAVSRLDLELRAMDDVIRHSANSAETNRR